MNDEKKIKVVRGSRSKPQTTLKVQPKTSAAHLFTKITTSPFYTESNGQRALVLASSKRGESAIYVKEKDAIDYANQHGLIRNAIEQFRGTALPKLYDMILDKLCECHFQDKTVKFRACELSRLTGNTEKHADRVKKRFVEAAHILYEWSFRVKTSAKKIDFRMMERVEETRGGFILYMTDSAMEIFSTAPKVVHDTELYKLKDQNECAYNMGRWIEDFAIRQAQKNGDSFKQVVFTMKAIMDSCAFIPSYLKDPREYAHRVPWLESQFKEMNTDRVQFVDWGWVDGRPASIEEEKTKQIWCKFKHEHYALGPATQPQTQTRKIAPKRLKS